MKKIYLLMLFLLGIYITSNAQVVELIGTGMVDQDVVILPVTNSDNITSMTLGALYKAAPDNEHDGDVTFEDADEGPSSTWNDYTNIVDKAPTTTNNTIGFWSESFATADAGGIEIVTTDADDEPFVRAAYAYLYRTLPYTPTYKSYVVFQTVFFYHNGSADPYVYTVTIDPSDNPRDITVKVPVAELDDTFRNVVIDIEAGPVTLHAEETTWNYGESFFIGSYTLEDVPADVTEVTVSIYSPTFDEGNGDSFFVNGVLVDVDNDCGECEGQITSLDLEYLGDEVDATINVYSKKVEPDKLLATFTNVNNGDVLSFVGDPDKQYKMGSKIRITVDGVDGYTEIHTSCSQDIYVNMVFGDYGILAGTSHEGGPLCPTDPPGEEDCGECEGQITYLEIEYTGDESGTVKVYEGKVEEDKLFATFDNISNGIAFSFVGPKGDNKMGSKIFLTINDGEAVEIHTSCSQDIYTGMEFGDRYLILDGTSHEGGPLCEYSGDDDGDEDCGECEGQITYLNIQFTGDESGTVKVYEGKVKDDKLFATFDNISNGSEFSFVGSKNHNKMG